MTTNTSNKQLKTLVREEERKNFHHSTSSPSPQYLTVESQASLRPRRQSTPNPHMTWTAEDLELIEKIELEPPRSPRIGRSSSFKATKRQNSLDVSTPGAGSKELSRLCSIKIHKSTVCHKSIPEFCQIVTNFFYIKSLFFTMRSLIVSL